MPSPAWTLSITFVVAILLWIFLRPDRGVVARWGKTRRLTERVLREDALKHIHKRLVRGESPTLESIAGSLGIGLNESAELMAHMAQGGVVELIGETINLTPQGRHAALHIIRAHRLWERYLAEETGYEEEEWHAQADQREHTLTPDAAAHLSAHLGFPSHDPHGDPIPTERDALVRPAGKSLTELPEGQAGRVVHVEDEPQAVYAQLVAEGIYPGMFVRMIEVLPERIRVWAAGDEHILAPMVARNVSVEILAAGQVESSGESIGLADLPVGETAEVLRISGVCRGAERQRFLDLGIVPGTPIGAELRSAGGDPTAYRIRGALIALRKNQASHIRVAMAVPVPAQKEKA